MADLRPDRLTTYQSERKLVVIRRPSVIRNEWVFPSSDEGKKTTTLLGPLERSNLNGSSD
jgi:hypothetical protein